MPYLTEGGVNRLLSYPCNGFPVEGGLVHDLLARLDLLLELRGYGDREHLVGLQVHQLRLVPLYGYDLCVGFLYDGDLDLVGYGADYGLLVPVEYAYGGDPRLGLTVFPRFGCAYIYDLGRLTVDHYVSSNLEFPDLLHGPGHLRYLLGVIR